jgi:hypothetical protein
VSRAALTIPFDMEGLLSLGPVQGFGHCDIAIRYKSYYVGLPIVHGGATDTLEELPGHSVEVDVIVSNRSSTCIAIDE